MRRLTPLLACVIALAAAARAGASGTIFTLAGAGTSQRAFDGERATSADFDFIAAVAALPDGDVLVGSDGVVWRIGRDGVVHRAAGNGDTGTGGDGGPATQASLQVDDLAALPDGGFLIADSDHGRIRLVDPQGTITTVAGGGRLRGNGVPARAAHIGDATQVAADPAGGFAFTDGHSRVRRVTPDGRVVTIAGNGQDPDSATDPHGQPATSAGILAEDLAIAADGSVLIADGLGEVDRVAPDGTIADVADHVGHQAVEPSAIAALPDGGFVVIDVPNVGDPRVWRFGAPGSTPALLAGGGPLQLTAPAGLIQRLDGAAAAGAVFNDPAEIAVTPDGGTVVSDSIDDGRGHFGTLVRYVAPPAPGILAVALRRDARRILGPALAVALTQPATVALTVAGRSTTAALPAGTSQMPLPAGLPRGHPLTVHVSALGSAGTRAYDRARVYPRHWLPTELAELLTDGLHREGILDGCRRFGALRVDCRQDAGLRDCASTSVRLSRAGLRWGRYGCHFALHPRFHRALHPLRRSEWPCEFHQRLCPPRVFGRVSEAALLPSD